jgi:hypothetical protein
MQYQQHSVVSARAYALISTSRRLRERLFPEGLLTSPYEILDYATTLTLHDRRGMHATFARRQRIRFIQQGVSAILDHVWGDGVAVTSYQNSAGSLDDSVKDGSRRHLVVGLKRSMDRGKGLSYAVERGVIAGFTRNEEWMDVTIDHPIRRLRAQVLFPESRPVLTATAQHAQKTVVLPIVRHGNGQTMIGLETWRPLAHEPYIISWSW